MASVQINRGTTEEINNTPITDGLISFDKESNLIYMDSDNTRTSYGGGKQKTLTKEEYDDLTEEEKTNGTVYYITDGYGDNLTADIIEYDGEESELSATNVQSAIDEVVVNRRKTFKGTLAEVLAHYNITSLNDLPEGSQTIVTDMGANGSWYGSQASYDALPDSKNSDGVAYYIFDGVSDYLSAENIKYGNSDVKSALDSLSGKITYIEETFSSVQLDSKQSTYKFMNIPSGYTTLSAIVKTGTEGIYRWFVVNANQDINRAFVVITNKWNTSLTADLTIRLYLIKD